MADYWKSNDRKFCDFCKCWITDNKPSVAFHENGRRHKANVAKRISEISRNSAKSEKEKQKMDLELRKMEDAALRSYAQDISSKADLTAQSISAVVAASTSKPGGQVDPLLPPGYNSDDEYDNKRTNVHTAEPEVPESSMWIEAKSATGDIYYWNIRTNESVWKAPKEGFMPIDEYKRINDIAIAQQELQLQNESKKFQENVPEMIAKYQREQMKMLRLPDPEAKKKEEERKSYRTEDDVQGAAPIGVWQPVVYKEEEKVDLELPRPDFYYPPIQVSEIEPEPPMKRFKEKTVTSLDPEVGSSSSGVFKKRKLAWRGNARQRLDDE